MCQTVLEVELQGKRVCVCGGEGGGYKHLLAITHNNGQNHPKGSLKSAQTPLLEFLILGTEKGPRNLHFN